MTAPLLELAIPRPFNHVGFKGTGSPILPLAPWIRDCALRDLKTYIPFHNPKPWQHARRLADRADV